MLALVPAEPDTSGGRVRGASLQPCPSPRCSARCANTAPTSDALYELVAGVDRKVDALDAKVDRRFDEIGGQLVEVLRRLGS